jgi:nicotinamide riboside kinase
VRQLAAGRRYALYVLTGDDIPFVQDGTRDGEHIRGWMTQRFREVLAARDEPWIEARGTREDRLAAATARIDELLAVPIGGERVRQS